MVGRILRAADFERVLRLAPRAKSPHFALHHLGGAPSRSVRPARLTAVATKLSTAATTDGAQPVDDLGASSTDKGLWLGAVVPKRHARRSVTRSLLKRQIRAAVLRAVRMPAGLWVVRLRAPFAKDRFPSAASEALSLAVRAELDALLNGLLQRLPAA